MKKILSITLILMFLTGIGYAFERVVLFESFTSTT